jgi:predicted RNA-binding protein (virulence factor B family)
MMEMRVIPDGPERMVISQEHRETLERLWMEIEDKYQVELRSSGVIRRWSIRRKMKSEYRRAVAKTTPSRYAL